MPTISLTLPVAGTTVTAGLHSANYSALQTLLNGGLDTSNWAAGKIFAPSKLLQEGATDGQFLKWVTADSKWEPAAGSATPGYATTLPGAPTDGQESILVDSITNPTYQWRFRFNNGSLNTDKWEFVGGNPVVVAGNALTVANVAYTNLSADIAFTIPRSGFYITEFIAVHKVQGGGQTEALALKRGAAATADADSNNPALAINFGGAGRSFAPTAFTAADVVRLQAKASAGTITVSPGLRVVPVRVS